MEKEKIELERLLEEGQRIQLKPRGYSMYPLFVPGRDEAIIERADVGSLKRGDVVLYRRDAGILVLHRICAVRNDGFYMVGDNQKEVEGPLRADQIKGIMTDFVRKGKTVSVKNIVYRTASGLWLLIRPLRPLLSKSAAALKRLFRKEQEST